MLGLPLEWRQRKDPRLWLGHFAAADVEASNGRSGAAGTEVEVRLKKGALPLESEAEIAEQADGSVSKWLRSRAVAEQQRLAFAEESIQRQGLAAELQERLAATSREGRNGINWTFLRGKHEDLCRALCGLRSAESLEVRYSFWHTMS